MIVLVAMLIAMAVLSSSYSRGYSRSYGGGYGRSYGGGYGRSDIVLTCRRRPARSGVRAAASTRSGQRSRRLP